MKIRLMTAAVMGTLAITSSVLAAEIGTRKNFKCWIARQGFDGTVQYQGYDCNAPGVNCSNPGWGTACTVAGAAGSVGPDGGPVTASSRRMMGR